MSIAPKRTRIDLSGLFPRAHSVTAEIEGKQALLRVQYTDKPIFHHLTLEIDQMQDALEKFRREQQKQKSARCNT